MNKIHQYINSHHYLNISAIERACNMPPGTIRITNNSYRKIPIKYKSKLLEILKDYGLRLIKLGDYEYIENDIIHFSLTETSDIYEGILYFCEVDLCLKLKPTHRTNWLPQYQFINKDMIYFE